MTIVDKKLDVLDHGFVRVVDVMGDDSSIVQAARISYGKGTKSVREDRGLIRYLVRNRHTSPLEMCEIKFHIKIPMDIWRQQIRHRTANVNEYSTRYSEAIDEKACAGKWRAQSKKNKQGSEGLIDLPYLTDREKQLHDLAQQVYTERLEAGVAREQARKDLPLSTYTEAYWKIDLHNLFHFLALRMDDYAQKEIRLYANAMAHFVQDWVPLAWEAFSDYILNGEKFSLHEMSIINDTVQDCPGKVLELLESQGNLSSREKREFCEKLGLIYE